MLSEVRQEPDLTSEADLRAAEVVRPEDVLRLNSITQGNPFLSFFVSCNEKKTRRNMFVCIFNKLLYLDILRFDFTSFLC
ncbi:unnamed protein product [Haemonchus placei]|uniref:Uncharacterized protein n=1 Tax=Haemonchus placei TaxID=6290 RepID=A0A0N4WGQ7_HAEPC|nr:unnamed protein product [Haemonchus placei]